MKPGVNIFFNDLLQHQIVCERSGCGGYGMPGRRPRFRTQHPGRVGTSSLPYCQSPDSSAIRPPGWAHACFGLRRLGNRPGGSDLGMRTPRPQDDRGCRRHPLAPLPFRGNSKGITRSWQWSGAIDPRRQRSRIVQEQGIDQEVRKKLWGQEAHPGKEMVRALTPSATGHGFLGQFIGS